MCCIINDIHADQPLRQKNKKTLDRQLSIIYFFAMIALDLH